MVTYWSGECSTTFLSTNEFWRYNNLIGSLVNYHVCTGLPDNKYLALLITPLQTYSLHLQFNQAQQKIQRLSFCEIAIAHGAIMYYVHQTLLSHVRLPYRRSGNETSSEVTETKFLTSELKP